MAAVAEVGSTLLSKCLDFCQALSSQGQAFNFSVTIGQDFTFSMDTRRKAASPVTMVKKKTSPSTLRRNARRREEFLKRKQNPSSVNLCEVETVSNALSCDQCDYKAVSERGLMQHKRMKHRATELASRSATPERPRHKPRTSGSLSASPLLDTNREESVESEEESGESEEEPEVLPSHIKCDHCDYWVIRTKPRILEDHIQHKHKK